MADAWDEDAKGGTAAYCRLGREVMLQEKVAREGGGDAEGACLNGVRSARSAATFWRPGAGNAQEQCFCCGWMRR